MSETEKPPQPEGVVEKSLKWLESQRDKVWDGVTCGALDGVKEGTACHSWVRRCAGRVIATAYNSKRNGCSKEASEALMDWILSDELPWRKHILNADDLDQCYNCGVLIDNRENKLNSAEVLWICKVLRTASEDYTQIDCWYALVKAGMNRHLAFMVSCMGINYDAKSQMIIEAGRNTHVTIYYYKLAKPAFEFINAGAPKLTKHGQHSTPNVFLTEKNWNAWYVNIYGQNKGNKDFVAEVLKKAKMTISKDDGWGGKVVANGAPIDVFVRMIHEELEVDR